MFDKNKIKVITLDFDGTTLERDQINISKRNMDALKECQKRGIYCIPCTGRAEDMFPPQIEEDPSFRYWITVCGARIIDRVSKEEIFRSAFTSEETSYLCTLFEGCNIYSEIAAKEKIYFEKEILDNREKYKIPKHHIWYLDTDRPVALKEKPSEFFKKNNLGADKFNLYGVDEKTAEQINKKLEGLPFISFLNGTGDEIQFTSADTDRIAAVEVLLKKLGYTFENVMSIGDGSDMDELMVTHAALGVTLANGTDSIKKKADYITDSYDNDGLAKAIEKLIL